MKNKNNLYIVIPAYNEETNITNVVCDWYKIINKIGNGSKLVVIDDGSKDNTYKILKELKKKYTNLIVLSKENEGHGPTVMYGYKYALDNGASYVFQTDSDNQTNSDEFWNFWNLREKYDLVIGKRTKRKDGLSRVFVTKILRLIIFFIFHTWVEDANTPFRLMKTNILEKYYCRIPEKTELSNVILATLMVKNKEKVKFISISFNARQSGTNSINIIKIIKIGFSSIKEFRLINKEQKKYEK